MSYITAITDRTATDIATQTSKAFFNVVDWNRINNNAQLVNSLAAIELGTTIAYTPVGDVTITTIPSVTNLNVLLINIELVRLAMVGLIPTLTQVKDDWQAGINKTAPNYTHVNQWENTLDLVWQYWNGSSLPVCPTLSSNLTIATGTQAIYVDCLDLATFDVDIQGTGQLVII